MRYDVELIEKSVKSDIFCHILKVVFCIFLIIASVTAAMLFSKNAPLFVACILVLIISSLLLFSEKKKAKFGKRGTSVGKVCGVDLAVGTSFGMLTMGYGGAVRKRYEKYKRDSHIFTVFVDEGGEVAYYRLPDVSNKLDTYYKLGDAVLHISGTRFPVKTDFDDRWLCPICGEFNSFEGKICRICKKKILK